MLLSWFSRCKRVQAYGFELVAQVHTGANPCLRVGCPVANGCKRDASLQAKGITCTMERSEGDHVHLHVYFHVPPAKPYHRDGPNGLAPFIFESVRPHVEPHGPSGRHTGRVRGFGQTICPRLTNTGVVREFGQARRIQAKCPPANHPWNSFLPVCVLKRT